jgi:hypothetical protein
MPLNPNDHYVTPCRVAIADGKLLVTVLPDEGQPSINLGLVRLPLRPAAVFAVLILAGAGIWYARRRARRARLPAV